MSVAGKIGLAVACVAGGAVVALGVTTVFPQMAFGSEAETHTSKVVTAVREMEQIALVSLAIEGIKESRESAEIWGFDIPGGDQVSFIQYSFNTKLGIDGAAVEVVETGEQSVRISIPEFIFIGHDEIEFKTAAEDNGALSWIATDIDPLEVVNDVLDDEAQLEHVAAHEELLEEQAEVFFRSIVLSVDPAIAIDFDFSE